MKEGEEEPERKREREGGKEREANGDVGSGPWRASKVPPSSDRGE